MPAKRKRKKAKRKFPPVPKTKGGLTAAGRAYFKKKEGFNLKAPVKRGDNPRRASFLARMGASKGPDYKVVKGKKVPTRKLLSLRQWGASSSEDARKKAKAISKRNKAKKGKK